MRASGLKAMGCRPTGGGVAWGGVPGGLPYWAAGEHLVLQSFFLIVLFYFSFVLVVYLLGEVDVVTPILHIFSFTLYLPFVSLIFPWT